eukprot:363869-Chlamydomonas_euryale.AAC.41
MHHALARALSSRCLSLHATAEAVARPSGTLTVAGAASCMDGHERCGYAALADGARLVAALRLAGLRAVAAQGALAFARRWLRRRRRAVPRLRTALQQHVEGIHAGDASDAAATPARPPDNARLTC